MKLTLLVSFGFVLIVATLAQENDRAVEEEDLPEEISRRKRQIDPEVSMLQDLGGRRQKTRPPGQRRQEGTVKKSLPPVPVEVEAPSSELTPQHASHMPHASVSDPDNMPVRVPHKVVYHTQLDDDDDNSEQLKDHVEPPQDHRMRVSNSQKMRPRPVYISMMPQPATQETRYYRNPRPHIVRYPVAGDTLPKPDKKQVHHVNPHIVYYQDQMDDANNEKGADINSRPHIVKYPVAGDTLPKPDKKQVHHVNPHIVYYQDQLDDANNEKGADINPRPHIVRYPVAGDTLPKPDKKQVHHVYPHIVYYQDQLDDAKNEMGTEINPRPHIVRYPVDEGRHTNLDKTRVHHMNPKIVYYQDQLDDAKNEMGTEINPRPHIVRYPVAGDTLPNQDKTRIHHMNPNIVYYQDQLDEDKNELGIEIKVSLNNQDLSPMKRPLPRPTPLHQNRIYLMDNTQQHYTS